MDFNNFIYNFNIYFKFKQKLENLLIKNLENINKSIWIIKLFEFF
jgi:hypothetical protein